MNFTYSQPHSEVIQLIANDGTQEAKIKIFRPRKMHGGQWQGARVSYPIMGDESPEFAEVMGTALIQAAAIARKLNADAALRPNLEGGNK